MKHGPQKIEGHGIAHGLDWEANLIQRTIWQQKINCLYLYLTVMIKSIQCRQKLSFPIVRSVTQETRRKDPKWDAHSGSL